MLDRKWVMAVGIAGVATLMWIGSARARSVATTADAFAKEAGAYELATQDEAAQLAEKKDGGATFELAEKKDGGFSLELADKKEGGATFELAEKKDGGFSLELADKKEGGATLELPSR